MAGAGALAALGVRRVFTVAGAATSIAAWVACAKLEMVETETLAGAVVMAATTGDLDGVPGVVVLEPAGDLGAAVPALRQARHARSPILVAVPTARLAGSGAGDARHPAHASNRAGLPNAPSEAGTLHQLPAEATKGTACSLVDAVTLAMVDPRGPVQVELSSVESPDDRRHVRDGRAVDSAVLDEAARHVAASIRPVVLVGLQARSLQDAEWVRAFAEALPAPVVSTARGRGVLPEPHPLALGVLGRHASVLDRADLVVVLGVDSIELEDIDWRPGVPVLEVTRAVAASAVETRRLAVQGEIALVLEELAPRLRGRTRADWDVAELDQIKRVLSSAGPLNAPPSSSPGSAASQARAVEIVTRARALTPPGAIAVMEGRWTRASGGWQCVTPGDLLESRPDGDVGFAMPAAIAAALARPHVPVLAFLDDEGADTSIPELGTAHRLGLPIVMIRLGKPAALSVTGPDPRFSAISGPADHVLPHGLAGVPGLSGPVLLQIH